MEITDPEMEISYTAILDAMFQDVYKVQLENNSNNKIYDTGELILRSISELKIYVEEFQFLLETETD